MAVDFTILALVQFESIALANTNCRHSGVPDKTINERSQAGSQVFTDIQGDQAAPRSTNYVDAPPLSMHIATVACGG